MFNFIFHRTNYNQADLWMNAMILKEQKKLEQQTAIQSSGLALQQANIYGIKPQPGSGDHRVFVVSEDEQDLEKIRELNSELDTIPLLPGLGFAI